MEVRVKYHGEDLNKLKHIGGKNKSVMIDLYTAEDIEIDSGEYKMISLGVSMEIPEGYQANIVPRSSTFKKYGIIQSNHYGVIDTSYSGDDDIWHMPVYKPVKKEDIRDMMIGFLSKIVQDKGKDKFDVDEFVNDTVKFNKVTIPKNTRLCQFEIKKVMKDVEFKEVEHLGNESRGGFGSTDDKED